MSNQPSDLQVQQKILYLLDLGQKEYQKYIYENYLNTEEIPLFMREFYSESSSWFTNTDIDSMKNTIHWSTIQDSQKLKLLDQDIEEYFDYDDSSSEYSERSYRSDRSSRSYRSDRSYRSSNSSRSDDSSDSSRNSIISKLSKLSIGSE